MSGKLNVVIVIQILAVHGQLHVTPFVQLYPTGVFLQDRSSVVLYNEVAGKDSFVYHIAAHHC